MPNRTFLSVLSSYLVALAWVYVFMEYDVPALVIAFSVFFAAWVIFSVPRRAGNGKEDIFWLCCLLLISLACSLNRCRATDYLAIPAIHGIAGYWLLCRAGLLTAGKSSAFLPLDLLDAFLLSPFGGFFLRITAIFRGAVSLFRGTKENPTKTVQSAIAAVIVLLFAIPVLIKAADLLGQADETFAELVASITRIRLFGDGFADFLIHLLFSLPVGAYLYGLAADSARRSAPRFSAADLRKTGESLRLVPMPALAVAMGSFIALYFLFFGVQAGHLLGAFYGNVPGTLTAAQYAREGFFQLCQVMAINFGLLAVAAKIGRTGVRSHSLMRVFSNILMVQSIFLAITAASKLLLYIRRFGFTPLRLLSVWGVTVLAAGCVLALFSLRKNCGAIRKWILFAAATFTLLCFY